MAQNNTKKTENLELQETVTSNNETTTSTDYKKKTIAQVQQEYFLLFGHKTETIYDLYQSKDILQSKLTLILGLEQTKNELKSLIQNETKILPYVIEVKKEVELLWNDMINLSIADSKGDVKEVSEKIKTRIGVDQYAKLESQVNKKLETIKILNPLVDKIWDLKGYSGNKWLLMSTIYLCMVPEKSFDPMETALIETEFSTFPVFRIRRCVKENKNSADCCAFFVDLNGRVYDNFNAFKMNNCYPSGTIVAPINGIYNSKPNAMGEFSASLEIFANHTKITTYADTENPLLIGLAAAGITAAVLVPVLTYPATMLTIGLCKRFIRNKARLSNSAREVLTDGLLCAGATGVFEPLYGIENIIKKIQGSKEEMSENEISQVSASLFLLTHSVYNFHVAKMITEFSRTNNIESIRQRITDLQRKAFDKLVDETNNVRGIEAGQQDIIRAYRKVNTAQFKQTFKAVNNESKDTVIPNSKPGVRTPSATPVFRANDNVSKPLKALLLQIPLNFVEKLSNMDPNEYSVENEAAFLKKYGTIKKDVFEKFVEFVQYFQKKYSKNIDEFMQKHYKSVKIITIDYNQIDFLCKTSGESIQDYVLRLSVEKFSEIEQKVLNFFKATILTFLDEKSVEIIETFSAASNIQLIFTDEIVSTSNRELTETIKYIITQIVDDQHVRLFFNVVVRFIDLHSYHVMKMLDMYISLDTFVLDIFNSLSKGDGKYDEIMGKYSKLDFADLEITVLDYYLSRRPEDRKFTDCNSCGGKFYQLD